MFAYHLASELGIADVDEMLDQMTSEQMTMWLAFYKIRNNDTATNDIERALARGMKHGSR